MIADLEDTFVAEARRQGWQPDKGVMTQLALTMAGSQVHGDYIVLPSGQAIHVRDAVKSLGADRARHEDDPNKSIGSNTLRPGTLTERMRREISSERAKPLPSDWQDIRSNKVGLTAEMMDAVAVSRRKSM